MNLAARNFDRMKPGSQPADTGLSRNRCLRPPWSTERQIRDLCTACGDCIRACPEAILIAGPAGTPCIDFTVGNCTFCGDCARACDENLFADTDTIPWTLTAIVEPTCLLTAGISCQSCTDACDDEAIRFDMRAGIVGSVTVSPDNCTACGACVSVCPAGAIRITPKPAETP